MQSYTPVHNERMRLRGGLAVFLVSLVVAGCSDAASRRLGDGTPGETAHPSTDTGGGKPAPTTTSTGTNTTPTAAPCPPESSPSTACASTSFKATPPPLGLYLMLDRSGSMNDPTSGGASKWQALTEAFQEFLQAPPVPSLSVAAQFFPADGAECEPTSYQSPAVSLGLASTTKGSLLSALFGVNPKGATPTGPALKGAITQARLWARQQPKMTFAVVLATDGLPSACSPLLASDLQAIAAEGATAQGKDPAIPTFVVGILGVNDIGSGALGVLDAVAQGGGTGKATRLSPSADLAEQMTAALRAVASQRVACSFELPSVIAEDADLAKLNVILEGSCGRIELPYTSGACSGDGWRYDVDPKSGFPRAVELCPVSCDRYRAGDQASLEFGCTTKGWPTN